MSDLDVYNGVFRNVTQLSVYDGSAWRTVSELWAYHDGQWRPINLINETIEPTSVTLIESGASTSLSWTQPEAGTPDSYRIEIQIGSGSWQILESAYTGTSPYTFNICTFGSNTDTAKCRIQSKYGAVTSDFVESNAETISTC